ncbi:MAG TPA: CHASE domain-containing protein [Noviherbaspirillum sp.]|nr:CHASE domain-containing protein [Noviherbaspirillum sp.]
MVISCALSLLVTRMVEDKNKAQFDYLVNSAQFTVQARVHSYVDVLNGVKALFYTNNQLTRAQFLAYVQKLHIEKSFPGIESLNFALRVLGHEKAAFEEAVRHDSSIDPNGYPDFSIKPPGQRAEYHVLTYLEPMTTNRGVFGKDMASTPWVAETLALSRDSGQLISSGRIIRIKENKQITGLAMRIPLYRSGMPTDTIAQRRAAYYGSVGAGFDLNKLMLGAVDQNTLHYLRVRLFDIGRQNERLLPGTTDPNRLLFDSAAVSANGGKLPAPAADTDSLFIKRVSMAIGPRVWEAEFSAQKSTIQTVLETYLPWLVLIGGLMASTMLYSVYYSMMTARRRAMELAHDMTKDLRASEASLAQAQQMARLGGWVLEPHSGKMEWSTETYRIFGLGESPQGPCLEDFMQCIYVEDRAKLRQGFDHSIISGNEFTLEHRINQDDGTLRWVHTIARLGHDERHLLLRGTIRDITERKHTMEALKRSQELLRELTAHQDRVKEDERKRIAREIHDELGQTLLALRIDVSMLDARTGKSHPRLNERVRGALNHIDATVKTVRAIINNLRPAVLDLGLAAAIEWQVAEFRRRTGIACDLVMDEKEFSVDDARATSLFRILQESLTNVIRHANATRVMIELYQQNNRLVMQITDNGIGIYTEGPKPAASFGLVGVEERIHSLHGEFRIDSAPGKGTTLTIYIPLETDDEMYPLNLVDSSEE